MESGAQASRQDLERRLLFETLLTRLSATFVNLPLEEVDKEILQCLKIIGKFLELELINVAQFFGNMARLEITHSWAAPGIRVYPQLI